MHSAESNKIYDKQYAADYESRFLLSPYSKLSADFEKSILSNLIRSETRWLDVGCGTGYFLSLFPEIKRFGIDASKDMLEVARLKNPDVRFIQGDFRDILPKLNEKWDLISCMWTPYNYLDSMWEFDRFVQNLVNIVDVEGSLFIPVVDLEDLRPHTVLPYEMPTDVDGYKGTVFLTSTTWTWVEHENGKEHKHLIAPQIDYFISLLNGYFETIEVVRYPEYKPGWVRRKAIVAKYKFNVKHEESELLKNDNSTSLNNNVFELNNLAQFKSIQLVKELFKRFFYQL